MTRFGKKAQKQIAKVMHELDEGSLTRGSEDTPVTSHKRAHAIALSEARKIDGKVTKKKPHSSKK